MTGTVATIDRVTLFCMTQRGHDVLREMIVRYRGVIDDVIIGRDSNLSEDYAEEIALQCRKAGIRHRFRQDFDGNITTHYVMAVGWRWMIDIDQERLIVFHDSLLPTYRGFAPLVNSLINGERRIGVSAIFGAAEYDRGPVIAQAATDINYPIRIADAIKLNTLNYIETMTIVMDGIATGNVPTGTVQDEDAATYSIWRDDADFRIDWSLSAAEIRRFVDAVGSPYSGAVCHDGDRIVTIDGVEEVPDVHCEVRHPGKVIFVSDGHPVVICGKGLVKISAARHLDASGSYVSYLPIKRFRTRFT